MLEIERKFLIRPEWSPPASDCQEIRQAYLSAIHDIPVVRVRIQNSMMEIPTADGLRGMAFLTLKGAGLKVREEFEYRIPIRDAERLLEMRRSALIEKDRYLIQWGTKMWEVDVFHGPLEGLRTAEVNLHHPEEEVEMPPWIGEEVTDNASYSNLSLAFNGLVG